MSNENRKPKQAISRQTRRKAKERAVETLGERLKKAMRVRGIKTNVLDRRAAVLLGRDPKHVGYASKVTNDKIDPSTRVLRAYCQVLDIDYAWALDGVGQMDRTDRGRRVCSLPGWSEAVTAVRAMGRKDITDELIDAVGETIISPTPSVISAADLYDLIRIARD